MPKIKIECPTCRGCGEVDLPEHLAYALKAVREGNLTAIQVHNSIGAKNVLTVSAISHRLKELYDLELVTRHRVGKSLHYQPKKLK